MRTLLVLSALLLVSSAALAQTKITAAPFALSSDPKAYTEIAHFDDRMPAFLTGRRADGSTMVYRVRTGDKYGYTADDLDVDSTFLSLTILGDAIVATTALNATLDIVDSSLHRVVATHHLDPSNSRTAILCDLTSGTYHLVAASVSRASLYTVVVRRNGDECSADEAEDLHIR